MDNIRIKDLENADIRYTLSDYSIIAAAVLLFTLLFSSPRAFAATAQSQALNQGNRSLGWSCGTPSSGHCYGVQRWGGAAGADTRISLNTSLSGGGTLNDWNDQSFITTEMWLGNGTYWVEGGIISEYLETTSTYPFYFWADNRPNGGGFSFHYVTSASSQGTLLVRLIRTDSNDLSVLLQDNGNSFTGTSTNNNFSNPYIDIGTELYNNNGTAYEPSIYFTNNRWLGSSWNYQGNDGIRQNVNSPVYAWWYYDSHEEDPPHNSTGGIWYSCLVGAGC